VTAHAIRLGFECLILYHGHAGTEGIRHTPGALLHHVREFVAE
jgi:hypothetical protein